MNTENKNTATVDNTKTTRTDIMLVDPSNIILAGDNIREDLGDIESLAISIQEIGIQIPLKAKKVRGEDKYTLADGHRRFAAIQLLISRGVDVGKLPVLPFMGNDEDRLITMMATGVGQKELTTVEQAEGVKKLIALHYTVDEIAKKIGKSVPQIYRLVTLSDAPKEIKKLLAQNKVSANVVVDIIKQTDDSAQQVEMVKEVIEVATNNGKAKATKTDVVKKVTPIQTLTELANRIDKEEVKNEKMELFLDLFTRAKKSESVDDILQIFN